MARQLKETQKTSKILQYLDKKLKCGPDIDFDYIHVYTIIQKRISAEIQLINLIFPEYTPHDEKYHIKNCFRIAEELLGEKVISSLNVTELFLLSVCLYAHDWGMAINPSQKKYILSNFHIENSEKKWLLSDERERFLFFLKNEGIDISKETNFENLSINYFQKYIRETHAERSGKRIFELFNEVDPNYGIGESAKAICVGHTLEFEQLENQKSYPLQYSLLRETVNLRALTIYVRLIDLFDLGEDRTPYVLWKFVAPHDVTAKMEWAKHRALHPITCPHNQSIFKYIQVNGDAYDPEVYAALEDLRKYCEDQLRRSNDILNRMNLPKYNLEVQLIQWEINPHGFEPINIRFEFDRNKMFEIFSSTIYQNDSYVFLRELLQNSIDAIKLRRKQVFESQGLDPKNYGKIEVEVTHQADGNSIITWVDDGIGMDEYVVKNYFSIAGKSYYRSTDFEKLGLKIDPISKYGIGILSCFNIANRLEIITYKDPFVGKESIPLKIWIPDISRQFRIEKLEDYVDKKIGTKIIVFVSGAKLRQNNTDPSRLDVTEYLKKIAGFVEFPILINENSKKTAILHPDTDKAKVQDFQNIGWIVSQHYCQLEYSDVFLPQDIQTAKSLFKLKVWDIKKDLQVEGFEGKILFFIQKSEKIQLTRDHSSRYFGTKVFPCDKTSDKEILIRWHTKWDEHDQLIEPNEKYGVFSVFNQGILLTDIRQPIELRGNVLYQTSPRPKVIINLVGKNSSLVDISRLKLTLDENKWFEPISKAIAKKIYDENSELISNKNQTKNWLKIGRIISQYPLLFWRFAEKFPIDSVQIPVLKKKGEIKFFSLKAIIGKDQFEIPYPILNLFEKNITEKFCHNEKKSLLLSNWNGDDSITIRSGERSSLSGSIIEASEFSEFHIKRNFVISDEIRFLEPVTDVSPIIMQRKFTPRPKEKIFIPHLLKKCLKNPSSLSSLEVYVFNNELNLISPFGHWISHPQIYRFSKPFDGWFAYSHNILNYSHPIVPYIIQIIVQTNKAKSTKISSAHSVHIGKIVESLDKLFSSNETVNLTEDDYKKALIQLWDSAYKVKFIDNSQKDLPINSEIKFIIDPYKKIESIDESMIDTNSFNKNFGKPLNHCRIS